VLTIQDQLSSAVSNILPLPNPPLIKGLSCTHKLNYPP